MYYPFHSVGLEITFEEADYSTQEGDITNPEIRLRIRRTRSPFTMTITPASLQDINQRFNFVAENFIDIPDSQHFATEGEC